MTITPYVFVIIYLISNIIFIPGIEPRAFSIQGRISILPLSYFYHSILFIIIIIIVVIINLSG